MPGFLINAADPLTLTALLAGLALLGAGRFFWLRRAAARSQPYAALDALDEGALVLTGPDLIAYLNPQAETLLGVPTSAACGRPASQVFNGLPGILAALEQQPGQASQAQAVERNGAQRWLEVRVTTMPSQGKQPPGRLVILADVTARAAAEQKTQQAYQDLRQAEAVYRQLVENSGDIRYILDCQGRFTYLSPAAAQYLGGDLPEVTSMHFRDVIVLEDSQRLEAIFDRTLAGESEVFDFQATRVDDSRRILRARQQRLLYDGEVIGVHGIASDVTEQLAIEAALARRAAQLAIVNEIGEKIAGLLAFDDILKSVTQLIQERFGYYHVALFLPDAARKELVMRASSGQFSSIFPANHRLKIGQGMVGWVADNSVVLLANDVRKEPRYTNFFPDKVLTRSELTVPILLKDELVGVLDMQSPQKNAFDDNDVRVMQTIAGQIAIAIENARLYDAVLNQLKETEHKENALRIQRDLVLAINSTTNTEALLEAALKIVSAERNVRRASIWLIDPAGGQLAPAAALGYPPDAFDGIAAAENTVLPRVAVSGRPALTRDSQADGGAQGTRSQLCVPLIAGQQTTGVIYLESDQPGAFTQDDMRLLTILAGHLVVAIERSRLFREVEQARAELEARATALEAANNGLREIDRLKSHFLANVSHELRTPLNSIIGFSEILLDHLAGPLTGDQTECVHNIYDSGKHLLALINDVLDFSKMESGRMDIAPTQFNVAGLLDELRITMLPLAEKKGQSVTFQLQPGLPLLTADRLRLKQVLINLLSNANKFTPQGGTIDVWCGTDGEAHFLFCVADNGIGIHPEHQALIFEEFRQVDGSMSREASGTGLGLAISKHIVELHHGQIWVESEPGYGARFYVRIPINYQADMI